MTIVACWEPLMRTLFVPSLGINLLDLVHLSNAIEIDDPKVVRVERVCVRRGSS